MKNKGITKFWIEIIGGVIIVVIILVIIIFVASKTSVAFEDTAAGNTFDTFVEAISKATSTGSHTVSPWELVMSREDYAYAIVYIIPPLAEKISKSPALADEASNFTIAQCTLDLGDTCLCLLSLHYKTGYLGIIPLSYDDLPFNLIAVDNSSNQGPQKYYDEKRNIEKWNDKFPLEVFDKIKVIRCASVKSVCSWVDDRGAYMPCFLYYKGHPLVWLSAQGGRDELKFEVLKMEKEKGKYYINVIPTLKSEHSILPTLGRQNKICATLNCKPCCGDKCDVPWVPLWFCSDDFSGSKCSL